jgi:hypothetical protein
MPPSDLLEGVFDEKCCPYEYVQLLSLRYTYMCQKERFWLKKVILFCCTHLCTFFNSFLSDFKNYIHNRRDKILWLNNNRTETHNLSHFLLPSYRTGWPDEFGKKIAQILAQPIFVPINTFIFQREKGSPKITATCAVFKQTAQSKQSHNGT